MSNQGLIITIKDDQEEKTWRDRQKFDSKDENGDTPLHIAADFGHLRLFKFIMEHASDKNPKNDHGNTPLHFTAYGDPQQLGSI